ncbi:MULTISPECIES: hypothetical protein [Shouchella]|uniref:DUF4382 domain-containing protein n=2 Tax=Shouchella TaxID=2893057 RepID=A0ABY7W6S8_9BACI|nr:MULTISPECIES: hypothetical protein [Shouchella]MED4126647.1 hypothetical protein [Shouchella miscanthi]WDF04652.1 hypothetical protein PQ477_04110 [Shouchella hunanensis]GAF21837.1 hypothetical protein JCM19047_1555 [Bacillus sp. JCM 19047]
MDSLKQALFFAVATGLFAILAACSEQQNVITDDDMVATDGTITNIEYEGNEHAVAGLNAHISTEDVDELPSIESFDVNGDPQKSVHLSNRTEVYIKHLSSYLRVNQSYLKNDIDVTVYEELNDEGSDETVATKIVIQSKDMSITGKISNVNEEEQTFFVSGEDGHYESGTRFNYDPATEVLLMNENQEYERFNGDLTLGLIVEVIPRSKVTEGIPAQSDTARVIIHEDENEGIAEKSVDEEDGSLDTANEE